MGLNKMTEKCMPYANEVDERIFYELSGQKINEETFREDSSETDDESWTSGRATSIDSKKSLYQEIAENYLDKESGTSLVIGSTPSSQVQEDLERDKDNSIDKPYEEKNGFTIN